MAYHAKHTRILVDEFDFSGESNSVVVNIGAGTIDVTPFQATALEFLMSNAGGTITHNGYFTPGSDGELEKEIYDRIGASGVVSALFATDITTTAGYPAYTIPTTWADQFEVDAPVDGVITVNGNWNGGNGIRRGMVMWRGTFSATGAQTSPGYIDLGAAGTAGGNMYLHVTAITGSATNATIDIESDTDTGFGTAASEGTATFSAVGVQTVALSGTVNRYVRLNCTSLGGATDFDVVGIVTLSGVTY